MERRYESDHHLELAAPAHSHEWSRLILKLRWIGLEDDARRLEMVVGTLRPECAGSVSFGSRNTD